MSRRRHQDVSGCALLIGGLLVVGLVILILKWALITAAILAVPFCLWWVYDRNQPEQQAARRAAAAASAPQIDVEEEARKAEGLGLDRSAMFWRSQPPRDPDG
ncbi:MAG: hypothetical protein INR72_20605 [Williamsia herbipolensis]|nr:hypothetical protein [Williamsia herbipolensis]